MPSWLRTTLKLIFTGVILGILVRIAGARDILSAFDSLAWHAVAAMIICALIRRFVISTQLWLILRQSGLSVSVFRVFLANALAALYSIFLPGNIASAGVKWLDLSAATGKKAAVFNGVVNVFAGGLPDHSKYRIRMCLSSEGRDPSGAHAS
jgi:hypothetical protein